MRNRQDQGNECERRHRRNRFEYWGFRKCEVCRDFPPELCGNRSFPGSWPSQIVGSARRARRNTVPVLFPWEVPVCCWSDAIARNNRTVAPITAETETNELKESAPPSPPLLSLSHIQVFVLQTSAWFSGSEIFLSLATINQWRIHNNIKHKDYIDNGSSRFFVEIFGAPIPYKIRIKY